MRPQEHAMRLHRSVALPVTLALIATSSTPSFAGSFEEEQRQSSREYQREAGRAYNYEQEKARNNSKNSSGGCGFNCAVAIGTGLLILGWFNSSNSKSSASEGRTGSR